MSTALATEPYRAARTERLVAFETEAFRPRLVPPPPVLSWRHRGEAIIWTIARLGFSPTPSIVALAVIGLELTGRVH